MATMDIFEGDAFTIVELTRALENIPFKPALLSLDSKKWPDRSAANFTARNAPLCQAGVTAGPSDP